MQVVTRYKAKDGSEWADEEKCRARDKMFDQVFGAMLLLKDVPTELNWKGYVQQEAAAVLACKEQLFKIANQDGVLKWWIDSQKQDHGKTERQLIEQTHASWFGRMLDGGHGPLGSAYSRLCAIDGENREWNQPYYAMNPNEGEMVCVG